MLKVLLGAAIGFAAAWFLDPDAGTDRRKTLREKATTSMRKGGEEEEAVDQNAHVAGPVEGDVTPTSGPAVEEPVPAGAPPADEAVSGKPESFLRPRR